MADSIPDPIIRYTIPGGHSVDLCTPDSGSNTCSQTIGVIADNGFGTFDVHNPANNFAVTSESWFFETNNLDQAFTASTTDFLTVTMERQFNCDGDFCSQGGTLEVDFLGIGEGTGGSAFLPAIQCNQDNCSTEDGFNPGSSVSVDSTFAQNTNRPQAASLVDSCCDGIQPDEHGSLALSSDVPEPGSLVLLLGAAGLLGLKRKLWRR